MSDPSRIDADDDQAYDDEAELRRRQSEFNHQQRIDAWADDIAACIKGEWPFC
jgi:hypothetical protein